MSEPHGRTEIGADVRLARLAGVLSSASIDELVVAGAWPGEGGLSNLLPPICDAFISDCCDWRVRECDVNAQALDVASDPDDPTCDALSFGFVGGATAVSGT